MKNNKTIVLIILTIAWGMQSCQPEKSLEQLKKEKQDIEMKIAQLEGSNADSSAPVRVKYVEVIKVKPAPFKHYIEVQGTVDSDNNILVTAKASGTLEGLKVEEGTRVKKGQVLATIDDAIIWNSIQEINTSLEFATKMFEKQKSLWDQKIGSEVQYLQAKNNKESLEGRLATLREQLKLTRITSPIDGTIDQVFIKEGEMAGPGAPIVRVVNLSEFEVKAEVAENYALAVKKGTSVNLYFQDLKEEIEANVDFVGNVIDPTNRTFNIVIRFKNPNIGIKPNMVTVVKIEDYSSENELLVPINSILRTNSGKHVFIAAKDGDRMIAKKIPVEIGYSYNGDTVIKKGLKEDDMLITFGFQNLIEGEPVQY